MSTTTNGAGSGSDPLEVAASLAIDLRAVIDRLADPDLRELIDQILLNLGTRLAQRLS
ncbi:hypothetical protein [Methylobacterium sp. D54C]